MAQTSKSTNGSATQGAMRDVTSEIETLKKDIASLTQALTDLGRAGTSDLSDAAKAKLKDAEEQGMELAETLKLRAQLAESEARDFVQGQPGLALGIAAGLGFLAGLLLVRR